jgi:hypothetical protein
MLRQAMRLGVKSRGRHCLRRPELHLDADGQASVPSTLRQPFKLAPGEA